MGRLFSSAGTQTQEKLNIGDGFRQKSQVADVIGPELQALMSSLKNRTRLPKAALPQLEEHVASLKKFPPVPTGALDPYEAPK